MKLLAVILDKTCDQYRLHCSDCLFRIAHSNTKYNKYNIVVISIDKKTSIISLYDDTNDHQIDWRYITNLTPEDLDRHYKDGSLLGFNPYFNKHLIGTLMCHSNCSYDDAAKILAKCKGDIGEAIKITSKSTHHHD